MNHEPQTMNQVDYRDPMLEHERKFEIDSLNILQAAHKGMKMATKSLEIAQVALIAGLPAVPW